MARIRTIKPEFPQSESMGRVSRDARLLFIELWTLCDDEGRTRAASRMLASLLFPYDDDAPGKIDGWLMELEREDCIVRYQADGCTYLEVRKWLNHQKIDRPSRSKIPAPTPDTIVLAKPRECSSLDQGPRIKDQGQDLSLGASAPGGTVIEQREEVLEAIELQLQQNLIEPTPVPKRDRLSDADFERAWQLYPKRDGGNPRKDALAAWNARRKEGVAAEDMIAGVERYAAHMKARGKIGTPYVMQAVTFFGPSARYAEDWPVGPAAGSGHGVSGPSMMRPNASDYSSSAAAAARTQAQFGISTDGDLDFN